MKRTKTCRLTTNRREYLLNIKWIDPWDESDRFLVRRVNKGYVGYWKIKQLFPPQIREYKTWKHNRKHQYKTD